MAKMYIMRGLPGSGKSTLAQRVAKDNDAAIHSADDWFVRDGKYKYNPDHIGVAHMRCQHYVKQACKAGRNVVVDNTNVTWSEVRVYVEIAKKFGYEVEIVIPNWTPDLQDEHGRWNLEFLRGRSLHGVPFEVLVKMNESFRWDVSELVQAVLEGKPIADPTHKKEVCQKCFMFHERKWGKANDADWTEGCVQCPVDHFEVVGHKKRGPILVSKPMRNLFGAIFGTHKVDEPIPNWCHFAKEHG